MRLVDDLVNLGDEGVQNAGRGAVDDHPVADVAGGGAVDVAAIEDQAGGDLAEGGVAAGGIEVDERVIGAAGGRPGGGDLNADGAVMAAGRGAFERGGVGGVGGGGGGGGPGGGGG